MKKVIVKILAAGVLAMLVGCSPSKEDKSNTSTLINGAGSTFDNPAFTKWFAVYQSSVDPNVRFNYQSIGSGGGQQQLLKQIVDFGASDAPMTDERMASAPGKILHLPVVAGGVAIIYNLPGKPKVKLDGDTLARIYLGQITKWDDSRIKALNPGVELPDMPIVVVHRTDGSGTTFIFTDYLSSVSPDWKQKVGKDVAVKWPVGLGGKGSEGVAGQVKQIPGSIGYAELAYANQSNIPYAEMKNAAGNYVSPTPDSVSAALATASIPDDFRFSMVNPPGKDAYPIAGASWVLIYQDQSKTGHGKQLVDFLKWAITKGQSLSKQLDYAPLPENVQQRELKLLETVKY